jgi:hypothetical protein
MVRIGGGNGENRVLDTFILDEQRFLVVFGGRVAIWDIDGNQLLSFPADVFFDSTLHISDGGKCLYVGNEDCITEYSLGNGELLQRVEPELDRPRSVPDAKLAAEIQAVAGVAVWDGPSGRYVHLGFGPRGWVTPFSLSRDGRMIVVPCRGNAAVVSLDGETQIVGRVPFEGTMRASHVDDSRVSTINSKGRILRSEFR